ncbi:MAG TPA: hypothetical protein PLV68_00350 [Ilumatobacteraceae bacterium]|nr:hypothetical protein [Ilumatobacteraceae bacterium]
MAVVAAVLIAAAPVLTATLPVSAAAADRIFMIGDSLTYASLPYQADELRKAGWSDPVVDGYGARSIRFKIPSDPHTGLDAVTDLRRAHGDADDWIVALGQNDSGLYPPTEYPGVIREMLDHIGTGHRVMWVNIYAPADRSRQAAWNAALDQVAAERPDQLVVYDWASVAAGNRSWQLPDKVHYTDFGTRQRSRHVAAAATQVLGISRPSSLGAPAPQPYGPSARLTPTTPLRALDTRAGVRLAAGEIRTVHLADAPEGSVAVAVNVTAVDPSAAGYLTVFPCGQGRPNASMLNYDAGAIAASAVLVAISGNRDLCVFSHAATDVIVDVFGGFTPDGLGYTPVAPARVADTRTARPVATGGVLRVNVGAAAALVNLTVTDGDVDGFVTVYPCDRPLPAVSNVNYLAGEIRSNQAVAVADPSGDVCLYAMSSVHMIVDIVGRFTADGGASFQAAQVSRLLDTRSGIGGWQGRLAAAGQTVTVTAAGLPGATIVGTLTVVGALGDGFTTMWAGGERPGVSNSNYSTGDIVAASVAAQLAATATATASVFAGPTSPGHVVFDVTGWFA